MCSKIVLAVASLAVVAAQYYDGHGDNHGHAVSSQNTVLHNSHGHEQHTPVVAHHSPVITHNAPVISYNAPVVSNHAPVVSHHAPVITHAPLIHQQPTHYASHGERHIERHAPAHYAYEYSVNDPHTGDIKSQHETRDGDAVQGFYSLHEADGTVRRVEYTVDAHSGFNAVVHREGHSAHAAPVQHQPSHHSHQ